MTPEELLNSFYEEAMVVNGVKATLNYYLRLIDNPSKFIENYTDLLAADNAVMFEHKLTWNELVGCLK